MLQSVLLLALCAGTLVEPFRVADAEPGHQQEEVRAAMAYDGYFAVAWIDHLPFPEPWRDEYNLYVRFFDQNGNPLIDAYKVTKMLDTSWMRWPCLEMDTAGNAALLYVEEDKSIHDTDNMYIRFQRFAPDGSPVGAIKTLTPQIRIGDWRTAIGLSLANSGEFAVTWCDGIQLEENVGVIICVQRFDMDGNPKGNVFLANDPDTSLFTLMLPEVALNDAGDLVVTWVEWYDLGKMYPRFQAFDADNEPILAWEPKGHRVDDGEEIYSGSRIEVSWFDNDRFAVFWWQDYHPDIVGRVFSDRGLTRHPIRGVIWKDSLSSSGGFEGNYSTAVAPNDSFAYTHIRGYYDYPDEEMRIWDHGAGILGYIQDNEPIRRTSLFEYTPPLGADTVGRDFLDYQVPAVACCDDRLVWVYSRLNTDTIFEAYAMITDWDMGIGVTESPIHTVSPIKLSASLNRLSYDVSGSVTGEAKLTLYSSDGRKVLEEVIQNKGVWTPPSSPPSSASPSSASSASSPSSLPSGVYFARVSTQGHSARAKVVILH